MLAAATELMMVPPLAKTVSFQSCYEAHWEKVFHVCLRYGGGNAAWAEDVAHDTFTKLLEHLPYLENLGDIGGWLYRVATNQALSRLRRDGSFSAWLRRAMGAAPPAGPTAPDELFERRELAAAALEALGQLPPKERVVLCMKLFDGKSQQEICETLSLSKGYVSKLVARGLAKLRDAGWEVDDGQA